MTERSDRSWQSMTTVEAQHLGALDPVVVLPLAAIEQHGPHLPLSTDLDIALGVLEYAVERLPPDCPVRVLPPQAVGASLEHARFAGTLSLDSDLLARIIHAQGTAVARAGARRLVLFNSHGGNRHVLDGAGVPLRHQCGLLVVLANTFDFPRPAGVNLPEAEWRHGLHGGAVETAMMLHLRPALVRMNEAHRRVSFAEELERTLRHVGADTHVPFAWLAGDLHASGATGDASLATAEDGRRLVEHYGQLLAEVIQDVRAFPMDRLA
jgi:creatinine amidohydrolase